VRGVKQGKLLLGIKQLNVYLRLSLKVDQGKTLTL
jgi:hypothetical protein